MPLSVRPAARLTVSLALAIVFAVAARAQVGSDPIQAPARMGSDPTQTWVDVPAGEFWMGRTRLYLMDEIGWNLRERMDDRPVHRVSLAPFANGAREGTNPE